MTNISSNACVRTLEEQFTFKCSYLQSMHHPVLHATGQEVLCGYRHNSYFFSLLMFSNSTLQAQAIKHPNSKSALVVRQVERQGSTVFVQDTGYSNYVQGYGNYTLVRDMIFLVQTICKHEVIRLKCPRAAALKVQTVDSLSSHLRFTSSEVCET